MRRAPLTALLTPAIVAAALVVAGNLVVLGAWTAPQWSSQRGVAGGAADIENARRRVAPALQMARDTYGRVARAATDLEDFRGRMVATVGGAELLGLLDGAGDGVGIDLDDATIQYTPIPELGVVELGIRFPVTGTYEAMRRLLNELAALPVFLIVDAVALRTTNNAGAPGVTRPVHVDLVLAVFVEDPAPDTPPAPPLRRAPVDERRLARLAQVAQGDDPDEIADQLLEALTSLPELPVDAEALIFDIDRLDAPKTASAPRRDLFSIVLPPPPPVAAPDRSSVFAPPQPVLPVRLVGVLAIDGRPHASITDGHEVFIVAVGDTLPPGVTVVEIGAESVIVMFNNERTVLRLEGNRP